MNTNPVTTMKTRYQLIILTLVILAVPVGFYYLDILFPSEEVLLFFGTVILELFLMGVFIIKLGHGIDFWVNDTNPGEEHV